MAWNDAPPTREELASDWTQSPPDSDGSDKAPFTGVPGATAAGKLSDFLGRLGAGGAETANVIGESGTDVAKGLVQGATLGGASELYGMGKSALKAATGQIDPTKDLESTYRGGQQEAQNFLEEGKERSPYLYTAGELGGSILPISALGGAGLTSGAIRGGLGMGAELGIKEAAGQGIGALGKELGTRAAAGALEQAPIGALSGGLQSKGNLIGAKPEEQDKIVSDILSGAATGSVLGAGVGLLGAHGGIKESPDASPASEATEEGASTASPFIRQLKSSFEMGQNGTNLTNEATRNKLFSAPGEFGSDLTDKIMQADKHFGQQVGKSIDDATASGITIDIGDSLQSTASKVVDALKRNPALEIDPTSQKLFGKILSNSEELTPREALTIRDQMNSVLDSLKGDNSTLANQTRKIVTDFNIDLINNLKKQIPGYKKASADFSNFRKMVPEQLVSGPIPSSVNDVTLGTMKNPELEIRQAVEKLVQKATKEGSTIGSSKQAYNLFQQNINDLAKSHPEAFEKMGITPEALLRQVQQKSDQSAVLQGYVKTNPQGGLLTDIKKTILGGGGTGRGWTFNVANKAGLVTKTLKPITDVSKKLYNAPFDQLENLGRQMAASDVPGAKSLGEALVKGAQNKDVSAKNALIFSILQNPSTRQMINFDGPESQNQ